MIKNKMIGIVIFILIISPLVISESTYYEKNDSPEKISDFLNDVNQEDFYGDIKDSELYQKFKDLVGDGKKIEFCGPAYINSTGKGLHIGRNIRIVMIQVPFLYSSPLTDAFTFPRAMMVFWLMFTTYNNKNATTTIYPLQKGKGLKYDVNNSINISGKHTVFCGVFIFRHPKNFRKDVISPILSILAKLTGNPRFNINFPIVNISGKNFLDFNTPFWILNMFQDMLMPFKLKIPIYGFFMNLTFRGYTPFVLWVNNTKS